MQDRAGVRLDADPVCAVSSANHSAVITLTIEALLAW